MAHIRISIDHKIYIMYIIKSRFATVFTRVGFRTDSINFVSPIYFSHEIWRSYIFFETKIWPRKHIIYIYIVSGNAKLDYCFVIIIILFDTVVVLFIFVAEQFIYFRWTNKSNENSNIFSLRLQWFTCDKTPSVFWQHEWKS